MSTGTAPAPAPLTLRSLAATAVQVPIARALHSRFGTMDSVSLVLLDLLTEEGVEGRAYAFCYHPSVARSLVPIVAEIGGLLAGRAVVPLDLAQLVNRWLGLPGVAGPLAMVASSIDTAAWDALAKAASLPLARYLGAGTAPIRAYNSNGLGLLAPEAAADEADALAAGGFGAVKMRLGHAALEQELRAVRAVRQRLPDTVALMVDFNQGLTFPDAMRYAAALDAERIYWIEEPIRHDDYRHAALLAKAARTPIQLGENFTGLPPMLAALEADASDYVMLDLDRIGGVTGWQRAAGLAAAYNREVSSHLFPEVSAHLMAATPGRHWLEYVDWAEPVLQEPLRIVDGSAVIPAHAGNGLAWNADAVTRYRLD